MAFLPPSDPLYSSTFHVTRSGTQKAVRISHQEDLTRTKQTGAGKRGRDINALKLSEFLSPGVYFHVYKIT